ncbi:MAG: hypothetical protein IMF19_08340, partial [Proteobacteria bacterium]|nr:hypothetical protein [Pseudomonadota bacterium]
EWWRWFILSVIAAVISGIIVAVVVHFGLPELSEKDTELKELSYSIEGPITHLEPDLTGSLEVMINNISTSYLFAYIVRIWNSGEVPLKNLPIRFVFNTSEGDFKIFEVEHDTKPKYEFGDITEQDIDEDNDAYSRRFIYALLNPKDEDTVTLWTNSPVSLSVYAKSERLNLHHKPLKK